MEQRVKQVYDEWLVLSYKSGNKKALGVLVKRWNKKLIRHIYYRTHNLEASKDIAQDCWIAIMKGLYRLHDPAEFGVWALRIANNKAVDWLRKQTKERKMLVEEKIRRSDIQVENDTQGQVVDIQKAYSLLDKKYRLLINLHYRQGLSVKQMARILKINEGTVKSRLFKARKELKSKIRAIENNR